MSPYGMGAGLGLNTPSKYASGSGGIHRGSFGGASLARAVSAGGGVAPSSFQQQQQLGGAGVGGFLQPGSYSSSSVSGGVRFRAGTASSLTGEEESSPGDGGGSFSSRGAAPASAAAAGAYGVGSSAAGGSAASSLFTTPQATPQSSPAPLRSSGWVTPSYAGLNMGGGGAAAAAGGSGGGVASLTGSGSWSQLPPAGHTGSALTSSSSYSGSANAPGFAGGLNNLLLHGPVGASTPRSVLLSPLGREDVLPLQGAASGFGLLNPVGSSSSGGTGTAQGLGYGLLNPASTAPQGSGIPGITPIPEVACVEGAEGDSSGLGGGGPMGGGSSSSAAAAAGSSSLLGQQQADVIESPLERRRSGYRSSMRKVGVSWLGFRMQVLGLNPTGAAGTRWVCLGCTQCFARLLSAARRIRRRRVCARI